MALTPPIVQRAIADAGSDLDGGVWKFLTSILGLSVSIWAAIPTNVVIRGITSGVAGGGTVQGKLFVRPQSRYLVQAGVSAALLGPNAFRMANAIGIGVANAFTSSALYQGVSSGVGAGTDVVVAVQANGATLASIIMAVARGHLYSGVAVPQLASAFGIGIASMITSETRGTGVVVGGGGPLPAAGTSISQVV